jgi:hypothetical protein
MRIAPVLAMFAYAATLAATGSAPSDAPAAVSTESAVTCASFVNCANVTIDIGGNGRGTVVSNPPGIDCSVIAGVESGDCTETFTWPKAETLQRVDIHARPADDSRFCTPLTGCSGDATTGLMLRNGDDFTFGFDTPRSFRLKQLAVSVSRSGAGTGRVTSAPTGISCGGDCSEEFLYGTSVSLTASPDAGAVFRAWTGACAEQGSVCTLQVTEATSTNAVFELPSSSPPPAPPPPSPPSPSTPSAPSSPPAAADRLVDADVGAAAAGRTRLGARAVRIELTADEPLTATLELRRGGKTLASKRYLGIGRGERVLTILLPRALRPGPATLRLQLGDLAGNRKGARRQVTLGRL